MKRIIVSLFFFSLVTKPVLADYILPPVKDRLVFLLSPKDVKFDNAGLGFSVGQLKHKFKFDKFWMQDRIWSDGICVGVPDSSPLSSAARIRTVQAAIAKNKESLLLIELVRIKKATEFKVTYLKLFDREVEYKRYFPKKTFYDTIKLTFDSKPKDSMEFVAELKKITRSSLKKLGKS